MLGHQDIHKIRGINRPLTLLEKHIFNEMVNRLREEDARPLLGL